MVVVVRNVRVWDGVMAGGVLRGMGVGEGGGGGRSNEPSRQAASQHTNNLLPGILMLQAWAWQT